MNRIRCALTLALVATPLVLLGCGGDDNGGSSSGGSGSTGGTAAAKCKPAPAGEKVTLRYSSWVPGAQKVIDLWNKNNPDIQVKYKEVPQGQAGTYQTYRNALKSGTADDLGFIEYDTLPSFRVQDGIQDIGGCPGINEAKAKFVPWTWNQVTFGEDGPVYSVPFDVGPMALFYRDDLLKKNGFAVPKTWDEFYELAKKVKAKGAKLTNISAYGGSWWPGLAWENQATWFKNNGADWTVTITDDKTMQVADYWQKFIDEDLASDYNFLSDEYFKAINSDKLWGAVGAAWLSKLLEVNSPQTSGKWRVAPTPQWTAGGKANGNWGGGSVAVFKGTKHPAEAAKFALWMNTDPAALSLDVKNGGILPATVDAVSAVPALQQGVKFLGGQEAWNLFSEWSGNVDPSWTWGPTSAQTFQDFQDEVGTALNKKQTLPDAFKKVEDKTVAAMEAQSISVTK
jgi:multiple sugar transport system substrate-binding protein